MLQWC